MNLFVGEDEFVTAMADCSWLGVKFCIVELLLSEVKKKPWVQMGEGP